jgi:AraC-like DNA-binding protein
MSVVVSSLYAAALTTCLFSAGLLGGDRSRRNGSIAWLTWFLVLEAATFGLELLMAHPATPLKGLWLGLRLGSALLIAPCLWLAVKEIAGGVRPRIASLGRGHLTAIAAGMLLTVPLIENAHLGVDYINPERPTGWLHARFIHATMLGCIGIFAVQVPIFLQRCRHLLLPGAGGAAAPAWVRFLLPMVATTWALGLLRTLQCAMHAPTELLLLFAVLEAGVAVGAIYILIRRSTLAPIQFPVTEAPRAEATVPVPVEAIVAQAPAIVPPENPYARSSLTPVIRQRIQRKLLAALENDRCYRDSSLNLRSLALLLKENTHYLSQVLNQDLGANFYDLVNQHRVQEAKALLRQHPDRTALDIALAVGFNSKSTFNTAFRRHTGSTPTDYRASAGD